MGRDMQKGDLYANSEGSGETAQLRNLTRTYTVCTHNIQTDGASDKEEEVLGEWKPKHDKWVAQIET